MIEKMEWKEIKAIHTKHSKRAVCNCDEYHKHSAIGGCLVGHEDTITILKLCETIQQMRKSMTNAIKLIEKY